MKRKKIFQKLHFDKHSRKKKTTNQKMKKFLKGNKARKVPSRKRLLENGSSEFELSLNFDDFTDEETFIEKNFDNSSIQDEDFILTKHEKKQNIVYFAARILNVQANDRYKVQFLKKKLIALVSFIPKKVKFAIF